MILRAVERLDPRAVYGRPWNDLTPVEQMYLLGYDKVRTNEEAPRV